MSGQNGNWLMADSSGFIAINRIYTTINNKL